MARSENKSRVVKAVLLVLTLLTCGVPALFLADPVSYIPLITVVLLIAISWLYLRLLVRSFSFDEEQLASSCQRGQQVGLTFTLSNSCPLPHSRVDVYLYMSDLFGEYDAIRSITVALGPRETLDLSFDARFAHVGTYQAGIDHVELHDLLGLFTARVENDAQHTVIVRPQRFDLFDLDISEVSEQEDVTLLKPIASDSTDYASVREYRFGDPLKTVHWNLSARDPQNTLYTRLYEVYVSPSMSIVMDPFSSLSTGNKGTLSSSTSENTREELMSLFDGLMEGSATLFEFARQQGVDCTIRYLNRDLEPSTARLASDKDLDELVLGAHRILAQGEANQAHGIPLELVRSELDGAQGASNIAYLCCRIDQDIIQTLLSVKTRRRNPLLFLCVPATLEGNARAEYLLPLHQLSAQGITCVILESNELETRRVAR